METGSTESRFGPAPEVMGRALGELHALRLTNAGLRRLRQRNLAELQQSHAQQMAASDALLQEYLNRSRLT